MKKTKKAAPAKKAGTKAGTKVAKKGAAGAVRNSRLAKFSQKIERLGTNNVSSKSLANTTALVRVTAPGQVTQMFGYMLEQNDHNVTLRTQKKQGSSKPVIKVIPQNQILAKIGEPKGECMLWVREERELFLMKECNVVVEDSTAIVTDLKTNDVIELPLGTDRVNVEIEYNED